MIYKTQQPTKHTALYVISYMYFFLSSIRGNKNNSCARNNTMQSTPINNNEQHKKMAKNRRKWQEKIRKAK